MPKIFLSPSTQDFNPYVIGGNEEYYMNLVADAMIPYLNASSIDYKRNDPNLTAKDAVKEANKENYDLYLALHSNASPEKIKGAMRGTDIYYYPFSVKGKRAANIIANGFKAIYPLPNLVNTRTTTSLIEVSKSKAPAVLAEIAYHDNEKDANWIVNNIEKIAENISISVADFLEVPFYTVNPKSKARVRTSGGRLKVRKLPSLNSPVIAYLKDGQIVDIVGSSGNFYKIRINGGLGYASKEYLIKEDD